MNEKNYLRPILLGGLVCGLCSGLPLIQNFNCCCCMWGVLGGGLAGYLLVKAVGFPTDGDGAVVGLGSGALGGAIAGMLNFLLFMLQGPQQLQEAMNQALSQMDNVPPEFQQIFAQLFDILRSGSPLFMLLGVIMQILIFSPVGAIGGFIGVRIFRSQTAGSFPSAGFSGGGFPQGGPGGPASPPFPREPVVPAGGNAALDPLEQEIASWLQSEFQRSTGIELRDPLALERLRDVASKARKELLVREEVVIDLPFLAADASGPKHLHTTIARSMFGAAAGGGKFPEWGNS